MRENFPLLRANPNIVYLDTAASAQKPERVLHAERKFYETSYANVHRSAHQLAEKATKEYENSRKAVADFLSAEPEEVIFTSGTTLAINIAARAIFDSITENDEIVVTIMEHHSNFVVWQQLAEQKNAKLNIIQLTPDYDLDYNQAAEVINENTKVVACCHVSNVLGTINDTAKLKRILVEKNPDGILVVDGAQAVGHMQVNVKNLGADVYCFSSHKIYGPSGAGVLYARKDLLKSWPPIIFGGEMVDEVTLEKTTFAPPPGKFEAGTPNLAQAVGLREAITFLRETGWDEIRKIDNDCISKALELLSQIEGLTIIGKQTPENRGGSISFVLDGWHPHDLAEALDSKGIAVRAGHHCTQPLHCALGLEYEKEIGEGKEVATTRASIGIYNTVEDMEKLAEAIKDLQEKSANVDPSAIEVEDNIVKEHIRDHYSNPRNRGELENGVSCLGKNPNCGDVVVANVLVNNSKLEEIKFTGSGCAISQAAMSILTTKIQGLSTEEISDLDMKFVNKITGIDFSDKPVRARCAMLGLRATQCAIKKAEE